MRITTYWVRFTYTSLTENRLNVGFFYIMVRVLKIIIYLGERLEHAHALGP